MSNNYVQVKFLYQTLKLSPKQIATKLNIPLSSVYKLISTVNMRSYGKTPETFFYKSKKYQEWRSLVMSRDLYKCVNCGSTGHVTNPLQVDHIKPKSLYPDLMYTVSNGRTLCRRCHRATDTFGRSNIKKYAKKIK